jgi:hypothetical protein
MNQFKREHVIMLPTNKQSSLALIDIPTPILCSSIQRKEGQLYIKESYPLNINTQHLYIISDDEIKEGDWCIDTINNILFMSDGNLKLHKNTDKKIIATTDTSLGLPQPSQQFIEKYIESYNKGEVITDVLVEYEADLTTITKVDYGLQHWDYKLKVNPKDNTITIKKLKDNWNREEHISDIYRLCSLLYFSPNREVDFNTKEELFKWIEDNL